jgi:putative protease
MDITSMQIDNKNVTEAKKGQSVGIKVPERVRQGDIVYKVA